MQWESKFHSIDATKRQLCYISNGGPYLPRDYNAVVYGLPNDFYHAERDYISSSTLKLFMENPKKYKRIYVDRDITDIKGPTDDMMFGSLVHCLLLEPNAFETMYEVHDQGPDGSPMNLRLKLHREWVDANEKLSGKTFITSHDMAEAMEVMAAIGENGLADMLIANAPYQELSLFCVHQYSGMRIKAKLDMLTMFEGRPTIIDLKVTSGDSSPEGYSTILSRLEYDVSAALYCLAFHKITGIMPRFLWAVVERDKDGDHQCILNELHADDMLWAIDEVNDKLNELALTTMSNFESPYANKINTVRIAAWRYRSRKK